MRKTERIIMVGLCGCMLVFCLLFVSCNSSEKKYVKEILFDLDKQLPQISNYNIHKFVIDERTLFLSPVVRWNLNGAELFMMIDTGCYENLLWKNGIKKALPDIVVTSSYKDPDVIMEAEIEKTKYWLDPYAFRAGGWEGVFIDGCLGLPWMEKYNNIVLDYVNSRIDYNQPPITDYDIPMNYGGVIDKSYCIPFIFNGKEMYGMLDTGSYYTYVNLGVIGEEKGESGVYIVHDFSIGNVHYEKMEIKSGDKVGCAEGAEWVFAKNNVLGYPCFKDHVIQLDFKNNVFRIK